MEGPGSEVGAVPRAEEAAEKVARVRRAMAAAGASACRISRVANFAWLSCGGRSYVNVAGDTGAASIVVTADRVAVVTNNIEAERLRSEELAGLPWEVLSHPWEAADGAARLLRDVAGDDWVSDMPGEGRGDIGAVIAALRRRLLPSERARAADAGRDLAAAMARACQGISRGQTEWDVAGRLARACMEAGFEPMVHLVAADARAYHRRHPLPTGAVVRDYVLVATSAMRGGLYLSATRLVHFGPVPGELHRRWRAAAQVDAEMIAASRPGRTAADVFAVAERAYAETGFPGEWRHHHQGGLAGYASREWRAGPDAAEVLHDGDLCAWNPTVAGCKSEDTCAVGRDGGRVLTAGAWPQVRCRTADGAAVDRPAILELP